MLHTTSVRSEGLVVDATPERWHLEVATDKGPVVATLQAIDKKRRSQKPYAVRLATPGAAGFLTPGGHFMPARKGAAPRAAWLYTHPAHAISEFASYAKQRG